jgi:hypothetical protein
MEEYFFIVTIKPIRWKNILLFFRLNRLNGTILTYSFKLPPNSIKNFAKKKHTADCVFLLLMKNGLLLCGSRIERHLRVLQLLM